MFDPTAFSDRSIKNNNAIGYGVIIGDGEKKLEGLRLLKDFVYEVVGKTENGTSVFRLNQINSIAFCLELQRYNLAGNFDRISSAIVAMFEFRKDFVLKKQSIDSTTSYIPLSKRLTRKYIR